MSVIDPKEGDRIRRLRDALVFNEWLSKLYYDLRAQPWTTDGQQFRRVCLGPQQLDFSGRLRLAKQLDTIGALLERDEHDIHLYWAVQYKDMT